MSTKKSSKKNTYTKITIEGRLSAILARATHLTAGMGRQIGKTAEDFEVEEHEDAPGTWWVNVWVRNWYEQRAVVAAFTVAAAENNAVATCDDEEEDDWNQAKSGPHKGRFMLSIYVTDRKYYGTCAGELFATAPKHEPAAEEEQA